MQNKVIVPGKVEKDKSNSKKYKIKKEKDSESDIEVEVTGEGDYDVEKLSVNGLADKMPDKSPIRWFNNFIIKKGGLVIKERFFVTIPSGGISRLVIVGSSGDPYYYPDEIKNNTVELKDGDPGFGWSP
jgi:hypothetical protein